jgi:ligand-binding SRPBCC domain-containing protein
VRLRTFLKRTRIPASAEAVFAWHAAPDALQRLTPPWTRVRVVTRSGGIEPGARVLLEISFGPLRLRWLAEHRDWIPGREFTDVQLAGPFACWHHTHRFLPYGRDECILEDEVRYALPLGRLGDWLAGWYVRRQLERLFAFRHRVTLSAFDGSGTGSPDAAPAVQS